MPEPDKLPLVSIVIPTYNMAHLITETLWSCLWQKYPNKEIIVYDDCSTDETEKIDWEFFGVKYFRGDKNVGVGEGFNKGMSLATGEIIVLMCADDLFTNDDVIWDVVCWFAMYPGGGVLARYYHQFVDGDPEMKPCRAWRTKNLCIQANNPSGLAFRREAVLGLACSNRMMIETSFLAKAVTLRLWGHGIIPWDTIKARVHNSTSTNAGYWLKRRVSSPVMDWWSLGAKEIARDYTALIQIKNGFTLKAVLEEVLNYVRLRPLNVINPLFWFFVLVAIITPRRLLRKIPSWYRWNIGRKITGEIKRPCVTPSA